MENIIFVAISKQSGEIMSGLHGQYAYGNIATLNRSLHQAYKHLAKDGRKTRTLYSIHEIDISMILPREINE